MKLSTYYDLDDILMGQFRIPCELMLNYVVGLTKAGPITVAHLPLIESQQILENDNNYREKYSLNSTQEEEEHYHRDNEQNHSRHLGSRTLWNTNESSELSSSWMDSETPSETILTYERNLDKLYRGTKLDIPLWLAQGLLPM
jgi:hypothetical protein